VDDRIDGDGSLSGLSVADDQLALATANRHHRINGFETGLQWFPDRLSIDDPGRDTFDLVKLFGDDRTTIVDRVAKRIHHTSDHCIANGHAHDSAGALHHIAFFDCLVIAKQHDTDL